jgi:SpoIID/LytB domain protein
MGMNTNIWKSIFRKSVCTLSAAALALSLPFVAGGGGVVAPPHATYQAAVQGGADYVYAADVSPVADHMIRVHLSSLGSPASIGLTVGGTYTVNGTAVAGAITIAADGASAIKLTAGDVVYPLGKDILLKAATQKVTDCVTIGGRNYPGDIRVINRSGKLKIVNHVDMETYVLGVVPYEAGNSAGYLEAIKAQAVAARTFAYYVMNSRNRANQEHDVVNTTSSQVYNGYDAKYVNANAAVVATACQILQTAAGGNVYTCYSASNGGNTEYPKSSGAAGTNFSYLPFKEDPYDLAFALSHSSYNASVTIPKTITGKNLKTGKSQPYAMLREALAGAGADISWLTDKAKVKVKKITLTNPRYTDNDTPRVYTGADFTLRFPKSGDQAAYDVKVSFGPYVDGSGIKRPFLNSKLGLSNKSKFSRLHLQSDDSSYLLAAVRYGHSAGMSQVGAYQMSTNGGTYKDILAFYYLMGSETKLVTKEWPIDNGVTEGPVPAGEYEGVDNQEEKKENKSKAKSAADKVTAWSAKGYVKVKSSLNVRSGPSTSDKKVGSLKYKTKVTVTGKIGSWYRIKRSGGAGFVMKKYVKITSAAKKTAKAKAPYPFKVKVTIKSGKLNVRSGAGTKYKKLGAVKKGATLTVKGAKGSWYKIKYKNKTAYILKKYVKKI